MDIKKIAQLEIDAFNRHDIDAFAAVYTENSSAYDPQYDKPLQGRDEIKKDIVDFFRAFPDAEAKILGPILTSENTAAFEVEMTGTHTGPLVSPMGSIPPTKRKIKILGSRIIHVTADGRITSCNRYYDMMGLMMQLGLIQKVMILFVIVLFVLVGVAGSAFWWWPKI